MRRLQITEGTNYVGLFVFSKLLFIVVLIFECYEKDYHENWIENVDLVIVFDVGDYIRIRTIVDAVKKHNLTTMNILNQISELMKMVLDKQGEIKNYRNPHYKLFLKILLPNLWYGDNRC